MKRKNAGSSNTSTDPDDAPEWSADMLERAEIAVGGKVVKAAKGTLTRPRGRPKLARPKEQVSVRFDPDVLDAFRKTGRGWQGRMNDALRDWLERRKRA